MASVQSGGDGVKRTWTDKDKSEFRRLVVRKALRTITEKQAARLEYLQEARRRLER